MRHIICWLKGHTWVVVATTHENIGGLLVRANHHECQRCKSRRVVKAGGAA